MSVSKEFNPNNPVFYDQKMRRRKMLNYCGLAFVFITGIFLICFVASVLINPFLPELRLKPFAALPQPGDLNLSLPEMPPAAKRDQPLKQASEKVKAEKEKRENLHIQKLLNREAMLNEKSALPSNHPDKPVNAAFYVNWDDSSYASLKDNIQSIDWLMPEWIRLSDKQDNSLALDIDQNALDLIAEQKPNLSVLPLLQNYTNEQWDSAILVKLIGSENARQHLIGSLLDVINKYRFGGITVDIEEVPEDQQSNLFKFMEELHAEFHKRNLILAQAVPFDNSDWDYKAYADVTDFLMLMAYDQHWSTGEPGAIAGESWFETILKKRMSELSPAKTMVCFGNYGYNWSAGTKEAEDVSFQEAMLAAKDSLDSAGEINFDKNEKNPHFSYIEDDGRRHDVWFLDATTAYNQIQTTKSYNLAGLALWRLGSEDPSLWKIFGDNAPVESPDVLKTIKYGYDVDFEGTGEILQVKAEPSDGIREIKTDDKNAIVNEVYDQLPSSYVIQRTGDKVGKIVLTFDDGPDPVWTPKILDILKAENVKAAFFIIGENGQANPQLVKRIVAEGHEIGNHSFTHPNLGEVPRQITDLELNTTQRLIESLTGHSTRLFRAPFFGDAEPRTPDEVDPTVQAQNLGYISVGLHIDPDDWKLNDDDGKPRTTDEIVNDVLQQAAITTPEERGEIVLLHDGGGDRSKTVEALPRIIHELKNRGFQFTTIADLANITPEQEMPLVKSDQTYYAEADSYVFYAVSVGGWLMRWIFLIGIFLGLGRMAVIGLLALAQYLRSRKRIIEHFGEKFQPFVSVVVPAYNEEKVIRRTIESLLDSDYDNFEIIVVDDGSNDNTFAVAEENFKSHPQVRIYHKSNGGKAKALNFGWRKSKGEIIICLDADTLFTPQTISALAHRFADPKIGAIAGNAKVGNRLNIVTKWQALEYVTSQNFDRRAFASLNCITVVPGSVGAWRREIFEQNGGFSSDTLAEDQDLTIQIRKLGYRIGYEEAAVGLTEAPDTLRGLAKQRFRWSFGTLQCMWKHKNALLNPRYEMLGFAAMPNVWIFQIIFPLISPMMDLIFVWTLFGALIGYLEHQKEFAHTPTNLGEVMFYYALFLAVDWLGAFAAFMMEKGESKKLLGWLLIQRFGYRQVMYWVMVKSVLTAIRGAVVGWGKLERKATVEIKA